MFPCVKRGQRVEKYWNREKEKICTKAGTVLIDANRCANSPDRGKKYVSLELDTKPSSDFRFGTHSRFKSED